MRDLLFPDHYQKPIPSTADVLSRLRNSIFNCFHNDQLASFLFALGMSPETDTKDPWHMWAKRCALQYGQACVSAVDD